MSYKLWIDDDVFTPDIEDWRKPPTNESDWKVATTSAGALILVMAYGIPEFIDFDHDLGKLSTGETDTSMRFLKNLFDFYPDAIDQINGYRIHSANPEGTKNIDAYMDSWKRSRSLP